MVELITKSFEAQCLAFPDRVERTLAAIHTLEDATDLLAQASAMSGYAKQLKAGIDIERPISLGVLKIKAKIGDLCKAKPPKETGAMKGKKGASPTEVPFPSATIAAYRKLATNKDKLEEYYEAIDDVPTQGGFISWAAGAACSKNTGDNEWYTPKQFIEAAHEVMGKIDIDPASSKAANEVVKAKKFFDDDMDGLGQKWSGKVWMNPPYAQPAISKFCTKLANEFGDKVEEAITLTNNGTETKWFHSLAGASSAFCFPVGRVKFWHPSKEAVPLQGQAICYMGSNVGKFMECFTKFGLVVRK